MQYTRVGMGAVLVAGLVLGVGGLRGHGVEEAHADRAVRKRCDADALASQGELAFRHSEWLKALRLSAASYSCVPDSGPAAIAMIAACYAHKPAMAKIFYVRSRPKLQHLAERMCREMTPPVMLP